MMSNKFERTEMNIIISELDVFLKGLADIQHEGQCVDLCNMNDETGHFVLSANQSDVYEIYLRFNQEYKNDEGRHKTLVVSVLSFKSDSEIMETKVLAKLAEIAKQYGYTYIMYEGITESIRKFAVKLGFKGYSAMLKSFEIDPQDTSFSLYVIATEKLANSLENFA